MKLGIAQTTKTKNVKATQAWGYLTIAHSIFKTPFFFGFGSIDLCFSQIFMMGSFPCAHPLSIGVMENTALR